MKQYLVKTPILDFKHTTIQKLIISRGWKTLEIKEKVKAIYNFVRDDIEFGYNESDMISASQVLEDGYGQCNTKSTLLMALLRAVNIPTRIHGFMIDKKLQKGAITGIWYLMSPRNILHSWVEVCVSDEWYFLEGVILDKKYLKALQEQNVDCKTTFCGYGVYTKDFQSPIVEWNLNHTYIQKEGINQDFGLFDSPDEFYQRHQQDLSWVKKILFQKYIRHQMNKNVAKIRG